MGKKKNREYREPHLLLPAGTDKIGKIIKMLGSGNTQVRFPDGSTMIARIRGKLRKRVWMKEGDIVLVSPWDFQSNRGDIFFRYTRDQAWELVNRGIISKDFMLAKADSVEKNG